MQMMRRKGTLAALLVLSALFCVGGMAQSNGDPVHLNCWSQVDPNNPNMVQIGVEAIDEATGGDVTNGGGEVIVTLQQPLPNGQYYTTCYYTMQGSTGKGSCDYERGSSAPNWANVSFEGTGYQPATSTFQITTITQ